MLRQSKEQVFYQFVSHVFLWTVGGIFSNLCLQQQSSIMRYSLSLENLFADMKVLLGRAIRTYLNLSQLNEYMNCENKPKNKKKKQRNVGNHSS
jgi:hypothetical protein